MKINHKTSRGIVYHSFFTISLLASAQQNVGIGTTNPLTTLDVNSTASFLARFNGGNNMYLAFYENGTYRGYLGSFSGADADVDFGTGGGNATGKVHLTIQASPRLTIASNGNVGIGEMSPGSRLEVLGNANIRGRLLINGLGGSNGQVLTSKGASAPEWAFPALSSQVRFGIRMQKVGSASNTLDLINTYYNLSPADITLGASSITINTTGLYRFNGYLTGLVQGTFTQPPEMTCDINFTNAGLLTQYDLMQWKPMTKRTAAGNNYFVNEPFELDIHLQAGTILSFSMSYLADAAISHQERSIRVLGYLINE